jgi:hypothetical protein
VSDNGGATDDGELRVVSVLLKGDSEGQEAVNIEGLLRTAVWNSDDPSAFVESSIARLADLPPSEQEKWLDEMRRTTEDR